MNPITLRQSFEGANVEAVRTAQGFNDLLAREAAMKRSLEERTTLEQANVQGVSKSDALRAEERQGRGGQQGNPGEGSSGEEPEASGEIEERPATNADGHWDLMA
jgi:hypothetical protein